LRKMKKTGCGESYVHNCMILENFTIIKKYARLPEQTVTTKMLMQASLIFYPVMGRFCVFGLLQTGLSSWTRLKILLRV
jgi:hypothetical protein